jgi:hypothetical protein
MYVYCSIVLPLHTKPAPLTPPPLSLKHQQAAMHDVKKFSTFRKENPDFRIFLVSAKFLLFGGQFF